MAKLAKPPWWGNPAVKALYKEAVDNFEWEKPREVRPFTILLWGPQGIGKTHQLVSLASVMKVYMFDSENRGDTVVKKFLTKYPGQIFWKRVHNIRELGAGIIHTLKNQEPGLILIDSATDLQPWAEEDWLREPTKDGTTRESVYPEVAWFDVWRRIDYNLNLVDQSEFALGCTGRTKDEYKSNKRTGIKIFDGYKKLPFKVDVEIQMTPTNFIVMKNGFYRSVLGGVLAIPRQTLAEDGTMNMLMLPELIEGLQQGKFLEYELDPGEKVTKGRK